MSRLSTPMNEQGPTRPEPARRRFSDPRVIEFRPRRPPPRREEPIVDPLRQADLEDQRIRMQQNLAAAVVLVALALSGLWLWHELSFSARVLECLEAGHHSCFPVPR